MTKTKQIEIRNREREAFMRGICATGRVTIKQAIAATDAKFPKVRS